jgi:DNA-binding LytR/AlgR family response regulator
MRIALCDDDKIFLENILKEYVESALRKKMCTANLYCYLDGSQLLEDVKSGITFDIILLDIDMPLINGKELARQLRNYDSSFSLVFVTSHKQEVYSIFQYQVDAFIAKDAPDEFFITELSRIIRARQFAGKNFKEEGECFEIKDDSRRIDLLRVSIQDIFYFICQNRIISLHTGTKIYILAEKTFANIQKEYLQKGFFEPCRGYLVNVKHMKCIKEAELILDNDESIPLSRRRRGMAMKYMREVVEKEVL